MVESNSPLKAFESFQQLVLYLCTELYGVIRLFFLIILELSGDFVL